MAMSWQTVGRFLLRVLGAVLHVFSACLSGAPPSGQAYNPPPPPTRLGKVKQSHD